MERNDEIITALDIGTTKIVVVIARAGSNGELEILGVGNQHSFGLNKGVITNIEKTVNSIQKAVKEAELMAGEQVTMMHVGVAGGHIKSYNSHGVVTFNHKGEESEITDEDVDRVIQTAQGISLPEDREIIHVIPQMFVVDGQDEILNPRGMSGVRLEVEAHLVTCSKTATNNIRRAVSRAGYEVADIILQPLASAEAVLNDDEKELGAVVIDMGGGTTDAIMYIRNAIWATHVVPLGGNNVTRDISFGLKTPNHSAELIKKQSGVSLKESVEERDCTEIPRVGGRKPVTVQRRTLAEIIEPRMAEIFTLIRDELQASGFSDRIHAGIVLTGGASMCESTDMLAERIFDQPVRVGKPESLSGLQDKVASPVYATAVGLARFGLENTGAYMPRSEKSENPFSKIGDFFKSFFG